MKIGIFDSGLGGLAMLHAVHDKLPQYDYIFYGDTAHVPYGDKTMHEIQFLTEKGVAFLISQGCELIILACNTASATVLKSIQDKYQLKNTSLRILGIIVPTTEILAGYDQISIIATQATVDTKSFDKAFERYGWHGTITYQSTPKLVPLIEQGLENEALEVFEQEYLPTILEKNTEALILGCTHYMLLKNQIRSVLPEQIALISQDEIIPEKVVTYLRKHREVEQELSHESTLALFITKETERMKTLSKEWFGIEPKVLL
jgi:glutamate racemase